MRLTLYVPGATPEQLQAGLAAAQATLAAAGVTPMQAARGHFERDTWGARGHRDPAPSDDELDAAEVWTDAKAAAIAACCAGWSSVPEGRLVLDYSSGGCSGGSAGGAATSGPAS